jgi:hypothetical protein
MFQQLRVHNRSREHVTPKYGNGSRDEFLEQLSNCQLHKKEFANRI